MNQYPYILEPYDGLKSRYDCPLCCKRKTFTRYIDTETGLHLDASVGKCSRLINCGYHFSPKQYLKNNKRLVKPLQAESYAKPNLQVNNHSKLISFIQYESFNLSLKGYYNNNFVQYLRGIFGRQITERLIVSYMIATSKHWPGASVFWQIDTLGRIRTGKIMLYNQFSGKRVKEPYNHITWVHKALKQDAFVLKQCFFGEHLLNAEPYKPVAIVESEKTAIIASVYLPDFIWIATGGVNGCKWTDASVNYVLKGRKVVLFPDVNAYEIWVKKSKNLSAVAGSVIVSDLLEQRANNEERISGLDIADYLVRYSVNEF